MYGDEELEKLRKSRFTADKGFQGAEQAGPRDGMRVGACLPVVLWFRACTRFRSSERRRRRCGMEESRMLCEL